MEHYQLFRLVQVGNILCFSCSQIILRGVCIFAVGNYVYTWSLSILALFSWSDLLNDGPRDQM